MQQHLAFSDLQQGVFLDVDRNRHQRSHLFHKMQQKNHLQALPDILYVCV